MKTLITTLCTFAIYGLTAQTIDKQVIASAGSTFDTGSTKLTMTIGEPIIGNVNNTVTMDQGFLAAATSNSTLSVEDELLDKAIKVYPNPVTENLNIDLSNLTGSITANIYNISGKLVKKEKLNQQQDILNLGNKDTIS